MVTKKQIDFIQKLLSGEITKEDNPKRYSEMIIRIQKGIDDDLEKYIWLVDNCPEFLADEKTEFEDEYLERFRRFKAFAYILSKLNPHYEIEQAKLSSILKKLSQLFPKYYFDIVKKRK